MKRPPEKERSYSSKPCISALFLLSGSHIQTLAHQIDISRGPDCSLHKKAQGRDSVGPCYMTSLPRGSNFADMGLIGHTHSYPLNVSASVHSNNRERKTRQRISCSCYFTQCLILPASVGLVTWCQLISSSSPSLTHWNMLMKREAFSFVPVWFDHIGQLVFDV